MLKLKKKKDCKQTKENRVLLNLEGKEKPLLTGCDHVCTLISCPLIYSSMRILGYSTTREPTTKKVALISF